jgi:hypothetical protein
MLRRAAGGGEELFTSNETELWIELACGSKIWFKGGDKPDSLYGEDVHAAVIDEATRCKEDSWYAVRSTLTATGGPVRIIGNVKGRKNWVHTLAVAAQDGRGGMSYHKLTAYDAAEGLQELRDLGHKATGVTLEEIEDAKATLPENVFRELYLAEPSDDEGNPFGITAIRKCVMPARSTARPDVFGADLAKSHDWTWLVGLDAQGRECVSERWQGDWSNTSRRILARVNGWPTLVDSTGVGDPIVETMQKVRPNVKGFSFTSRSKQQIMEGLAYAIQNQEVGIYDPQLIRELESFEYEYTRTGVKYSAPDGLHDDGVCALALAVSMRQNKPQRMYIGGSPLIDATDSEADHVWA